MNARTTPTLTRPRRRSSITGLRIRRCRTPWLAGLLALAACSTPPAPPTVDPAQRRPANAAIAIELQSCRSELQNTRILASEHARAAEASGLSVARLAQQQLSLLQAVESRQTAAAASAATAATTAPAGNTVHSLQFALGSAQLTVDDTQARQLIDEASPAPLILLRGRTDGEADALAEGRIARQRTEAVRAWLVRAGIAPQRIRTTWQPVGDHAADNGTADGRARNRRVEVEIYRALPRAATAASAAAA